MSKKQSIIKLSKKVENLTSPNITNNPEHKTQKIRLIDLVPKNLLTQSAKTNRNLISLYSSIVLKKNVSTKKINLSSRQTKSSNKTIDFISKRNKNKSNVTIIKEIPQQKNHSVPFDVQNENYKLEISSCENIMFTYDQNSEVKINVDVDDTTSHLTVLKNEEKDIFNLITNNSDSSYSSYFLNYKLGCMDDNQSMFPNDDKINANNTENFQNHEYNESKERNNNKVTTNNNYSHPKKDIKDKNNKKHESPIKKISPLVNQVQPPIPMYSHSHKTNFSSSKNIKTEPVRCDDLHTSMTHLELSHISVNKPKHHNYKINKNKYQLNVLSEINENENEMSFTLYCKNTDEVSIQLLILEL